MPRDTTHSEAYTARSCRGEMEQLRLRTHSTLNPSPRPPCRTTRPSRLGPDAGMGVAAVATVLAAPVTWAGQVRGRNDCGTYPTKTERF